MPLMGLIGMSEAAVRLGLSGSVAALRALRAAGVPLVTIHARAFAVEESDLAPLIAKRAGYSGRGRPEGTTGIKKRKKNNDDNTGA